MMRIRLAVAAILLLPLGALAAKDFTSLHPEEAHPDSREHVSPDPYSDFIKRLQEKLHSQGFDAGPVNGDFGTKTQAALAQFQLSRAIPASGQLDDATLAELGLQRGPSDAAAGATAAPQPQAPAEPANAASPPEKPGS